MKKRTLIAIIVLLFVIAGIIIGSALAEDTLSVDLRDHDWVTYIKGEPYRFEEITPDAVKGVDYGDSGWDSQYGVYRIWYKCSKCKQTTCMLYDALGNLVINDEPEYKLIGNLKVTDIIWNSDAKKCTLVYINGSKLDTVETTIHVDIENGNEFIAICGKLYNQNGDLYYGNEEEEDHPAGILKKCCGVCTDDIHVWIYLFYPTTGGVNGSAMAGSHVFDKNDTCIECGYHKGDEIKDFWNILWDDDIEWIVEEYPEIKEMVQCAIDNWQPEEEHEDLCHAPIVAINPNEAIYGSFEPGDICFIGGWSEWNIEHGNFNGFDTLKIYDDCWEFQDSTTGVTVFSHEAYENVNGGRIKITNERY